MYGICVNIFIMKSVYFKELHNEQEYYCPTIYRAGAAVVSTITRSDILNNKVSVSVISLGLRLGWILRYVKNDVNRAVKLPDYWTVNREDPWTRFSFFGGNFKMVEHLTRFTRKKKANYWISHRSVSIRTSDLADRIKPPELNVLMCVLL